MTIQIQYLIPSLAALAFSAAVPLTAQAKLADMAGTWKGDGATFALDGTPQGTYGVALNDTLEADGSLVQAITVSIPGQTDLKLEQTLTPTEHGFKMVGADGSGGATCVGAGLCEGYYGDEQGNGVAITIAMDGADHFRSLKTQLENFKAVRLYRETYARQSAR